MVLQPSVHKRIWLCVSIWRLAASLKCCINFTYRLEIWQCCTTMIYRLGTRAWNYWRRTLTHWTPNTANTAGFTTADKRRMTIKHQWSTHAALYHLPVVAQKCSLAIDVPPVFFQPFVVDRLDQMRNTHASFQLLRWLLAFSQTRSYGDVASHRTSSVYHQTAQVDGFGWENGSASHLQNEVSRVLLLLFVSSLSTILGPPYTVHKTRLKFQVPSIYSAMLLTADWPRLTDPWGQENEPHVLPYGSFNPCLTPLNMDPALYLSRTELTLKKTSLPLSQYPWHSLSVAHPSKYSSMLLLPVDCYKWILLSLEYLP